MAFIGMVKVWKKSKIIVIQLDGFPWESIKMFFYFFYFLYLNWLITKSNCSRWHLTESCSERFLRGFLSHLYMYCLHKFATPINRLISWVNFSNLCEHPVVSKVDSNSCNGQHLLTCLLHRCIYLMNLQSLTLMSSNFWSRCLYLHTSHWDIFPEWLLTWKVFSKIKIPGKSNHQISCKAKCKQDKLTCFFYCWFTESAYVPRVNGMHILYALYIWQTYA